MRTGIFFTTVLLILTVSLTFAQPRKGQNGQGYSNHTRIIDQLNLTDAQKNKIEELRDEHRNEAIDLRAELQKTKLALRKLNRSGEINKDEYMSLVEKKNSIRSKLETTRAELHLSILNELNGEQKKQLAENRSNRLLGRKGNSRDRDNYGRHHGRGQNRQDCRFN